MEFQLTEDKMEAFAILATAEQALSDDEIRGKANAEGIVFGLLPTLPRRVPGKPLLVARGDPPVAAGTMHLEMRRPAKRLPRWPDALEWRGDVALETPTDIKKDEVVALIRRAEADKPGRNVLGEELSPSGQGAAPPIGPGLSVGESEVRAMLDGHLFEREGKIGVEPLLVVDGDVSKVTGNIGFPGMVLVRGNVKSRLKVQARGNIVVTGTVEGAQLQSTQGGIFIKGGVKGAKVAFLEAKHDLFCRFAELAKLKGKEICVAESLFHCEASAREALHLLEGKGAIVGGHVQVGRGLFAKVIGSRSFIYTEVEVATDEQKELLGKLKVCEQEIAEHARMIQKLGRRKLDLAKGREEKIKELREKMRPLQEELEKTFGEPQICIGDRIYPGTTVQFLGEFMELQEEKAAVSLWKPSVFSPIEVRPMQPPPAA